MYDSNSLFPIPGSPTMSTWISPRIRRPSGMTFGTPLNSCRASASFSTYMPYIDGAIASGPLPDDHRLDRALDVRHVRGEGGARPAAVQRRPEGHAGRPPDPRGYPRAHGRRPGDREERVAVVHE